MLFLYTHTDGQQYVIRRAPATHAYGSGGHFLFSAQSANSIVERINVFELWRELYAHDHGPMPVTTTLRAFLSKELSEGRLRLTPYQHPNETEQALQHLLRESRTQLQQQLRVILAEEQREKVALQQKYDALSFKDKAATSLDAAAQGVGKAAVSFVSWAKEVSDLVNPMVKTVNFANAAVAGIKTRSAQAFAEHLLAGDYKEAVEVLGFDPTKITQEQLFAAYELAQLIYDDAETRQLLTQFFKDYLAAQHHTEVTEFAGGMVFDFILTLILAAITGGAGVAIMAIKYAQLIARFRKIGEILLSLGKPLKKLRLRRKRKVIETSAPPSASGTAPLTKYDRVDEAMHKAGEVVKMSEGGPSQNVATNSVVKETGARRVLDPTSLESWDAVEDKYDLIRANTGDVAKIAANIGWPESRVARIKEHVFFKNHQLDSGLAKFDADPDIYNAWNRLEQGDFVSSDIDLLKHEIFESKFEGIFKTNYRASHDAAIRAGKTWTPE